MTHRSLLALSIVSAVLSTGCHHPVVATGVTEEPRAKPAVSPPAGDNWPLPPLEAERLLGASQLDLVSLEHTTHGVAGAYKGVVAFPGGGKRATVKWKHVPRGLDGWNNNPRKELATYAIQGFFLQPRDYVVPTTVLRCIPVDRYRRIDPTADATTEGTHCVLGTLSLWLEHVKEPDPLYDPARFAREPWYAYHLANFNVLAYLVQHRDGRPGNILVSDDERNRFVFAVDNGISFGGVVYNFLTTNWDVMRVPSVPLEVVARLRQLDRRQLDTLGTVADLRADARGILRPARPGPPLDPAKGVRVESGRVQMGLTTAEIDAVADRIAALLRSVDDGTLGVF
jgi:hypothetical protein